MGKYNLTNSNLNFNSINQIKFNQSNQSIQSINQSIKQIQSIKFNKLIWIYKENLMKEVWVSISKLCDKDNIVFPTKTFIMINSKIQFNKRILA